MATWYGIDAINGFTRAIAHKYGVSVDVQAGQNSCTNGGTVFMRMPDGPLTETQFKAWCGVALHEIAHVVYGTARRHKDYGNAHALPDLARLAYNGVADVADESRLSKQDGLVPQPFFQTCAKDSWDRACAAGTYKDPNVSLPWKLLTLAMYSVSVHNCQIFDAVRTIHALPADQRRAASAVYWKLRRRAIDRSKVAKISKRTGSQWLKLSGTADDIVKILEPFQDKGKVPQSGQEADQVAQDSAGNTPAPGDQIATAADGGAMVNAPAQGAGTSTTPTQDYAGTTMDQGTYSEIIGPLRRAVESMLETDRAEAWDGGYASGRKLTGLHRAEIDGMVFARKLGEDHGEAETAIGVALDCSSSMRGRRAQCSAAAQAFMDAASGFAECAAWQFGTHSNRVRDHKTSSDLGGTQTYRVLADMAKWLNSTPAQNKYAVVITDGDSKDPAIVREECQKLVARGVRVVCLCLGYGDHLVNTMTATMPGAKCLTSEYPAILGSKILDAIRTNR